VLKKENYLNPNRYIGLAIFSFHSCDDSFPFQTNMESGSVFLKEEGEDEVEEIYNFSLPSVCYKSDPLARYIN
jgi:hypothetical protein